MTQSALQSFAYLKIHWESNRSIYIDNFIPFLVEALKIQKEQVVSRDIVQKKLFELFGLQIPLDVISAIINRAKKKGCVRLKDKVYYKVEKKLDEFEFSPIQDQVQRIYSALLNDFISYCKNIFDIKIDEAEAEKLLLSFIRYNKPLFYQINNIDKNIIEDSSSISYEKRYLVAKYIVSAKSERPDIYGYIDIIVKGYMISQALYLLDVYQTGKLFKNTKVFFDTPFIIFALGYSGEEYQTPCLELLDLLLINNADLYCFSHTFHEIESILFAISNNLDLNKTTDGLFGRTVQHFISLGYSETNVKLKIPRLMIDIRNLRINVVDTPKYTEDRYVMDEEKLSESLKKNMSYPKEDAIERDVKSISAIFRLRQNHKSIFVEESRAIFITTSYTLADTANKYFYQESEYYFAPPCLTDYVLTNIVWLKTPTSAPNLPMSKIIADSYAAIQPDNKFMEKWFREIDILKQAENISEEDYLFYRSSPEVIELLMEKTLGNPRAISSGTVSQILEKAREKLRLEAEDIFRKQLDLKDHSLGEYKKELAKYKRKEIEADNKIRSRAKSISSVVIKILKPITVISVIILIIFQLDFSWSSIQVKNPLIFGLIIFCVVGLSFHNIYYGYSIKNIFIRLELLLDNYLYNILYKISRWFTQ